MTDIYGDTTGVLSTSTKRTQPRTTALGFGTAPCVLRPGGLGPTRRPRRSESGEVTYPKRSRTDLNGRELLHRDLQILCFRWSGSGSGGTGVKGSQVQILSARPETMGRWSG
jgi:hypothetical protein